MKAPDEQQKTSSDSIPTTFFAASSCTNLNLRDCFVETYGDVLKNEIQKDVIYEKQVLVSKFAGLAIIDQLEQLNKHGSIKLTFGGRKYFNSHPHHTTLFPHNVQELLSARNISRLQFAIVESVDGQRVFIDLGSLNGAKVTFKSPVNQTSFDDSLQWMTGILNNVHSYLLNSETEYSRYGKNYSLVKAEIKKFIDNTTITGETPKQDQETTLFTNEKKIGWLPIPKETTFEVIFNNNPLKITNAPTLSSTLISENKLAM